MRADVLPSLFTFALYVWSETFAAQTYPPDLYLVPQGVVCMVCAHGIELIITRIVFIEIVLCLK